MSKYRFQSLIFCILLVSLTSFACSNSNHETSSENYDSDSLEDMTNSEQGNQFIIESDSLNSSWEATEENNSNQRTAIINPNFISADSSGVGREVDFNIYQEESLLGEIRRVSTDINGLKSISGLLREDKGSFVFTVNEDRLLGQIRLTDGDKHIQVRFSEEVGEYILTEMDRRDLDVLPGSAPVRRGNN